MLHRASLHGFYCRDKGKTTAISPWVSFHWYSSGLGVGPDALPGLSHKHSGGLCAAVIALKEHN